MTQPKLDPDQPVVEVEVVADTYADLAPRAVEVAAAVLGPGRYAALLVSGPAQVNVRTIRRASGGEMDIDASVTARFHVGTEVQS